VTIEAASLAIKSGNACILRGGSEAIHSNLALAQAGAAGAGRGRPAAHGVQLVQTTDRAAVGELIAMPEYVDIIIPRGGKGLIERISAEAKVPVIKHLDGNCHVYVDAEATSTWRSGGRQRQDAEVQPLQRHRVACWWPGRGSRLSAAHRRHLRRQGRGDALRAASRAHAWPTVRVRRLVDASEQPTGPRNTWRPSSASSVVADLDEAIAHINRYGSATTPTPS
jgi:glutamate-5-semialdehyde dehydrogenase